MVACTSDDPRIQLLKDKIAIDPTFTKYQAYKSLNISPATLTKWEKNGWIPKMYKATNNERSPWRNKF